MCDFHDIPMRWPGQLVRKGGLFNESQKGQVMCISWWRWATFLAGSSLSSNLGSLLLYGLIWCTLVDFWLQVILLVTLNLMQTSWLLLSEINSALEKVFRPRRTRRKPHRVLCTWGMKFVELASKRQNLENFNQALSSPDSAQISFFFFFNCSSWIFNQSSNSFKYLDTWLLGDQGSDWSTIPDSVETNSCACL